jgi:hypothetical protein
MPSVKRLAAHRFSTLYSLQDRGWMRRDGSPYLLWVRVVVVCAIASGALALCSPQALATEAPPRIDATTVTNVAEHSATIEVQINPQAGETNVEIWTIGQDAHPPSRDAERMAGGVQQQCATIASGAIDQVASLSLTNLQPGYAYWYEVKAANKSGETKGKSPYWFGFHTNASYPEGFVPNFPYEPRITCAELKSAEEQGRQTFREAQERRAAEKRLAEQQERERREAAEAAERKRVEEAQAAARAQPTAKPQVSMLLRCVVPTLKGDTLRAARRAIISHHCRVGKIRRPRHHRGALVVTAQSPKHGRKLADGAAIALTLGARRRG